MTDLEHRVCDVLTELMAKERRWSPMALAPNVAAAIQAAARDFGQDIASAEAAALAALRGTPSP